MSAVCNTWGAVTGTHTVDDSLEGGRLRRRWLASRASSRAASGKGRQAKRASRLQRAHQQPVVQASYRRAAASPVLITRLGTVLRAEKVVLARVAEHSHWLRAGSRDHLQDLGGNFGPGFPGSRTRQRARRVGRAVVSPRMRSAAAWR